MKKYKVNVGRSLDLFHSLKGLINKGACYNNCFHLGSHVQWILKEEVKVAYGYFSQWDIGIYVRHCVLIINNEIIDASLCAGGVEIDSDKYDFIPFEIMTFDEFVETCEANDLRTDLPNSKHELNCYLENFHMMKEGKTISEQDFFNYIMKKLSKHNLQNSLK